MQSNAIEPVQPDFVNRGEQLTFFWKMAEQCVTKRIMLVRARFGMGKTYLLKEFRAECKDQRIQVVFLDLKDRYEDPGYMQIVREIVTQLGGKGFDQLINTLQTLPETINRKIAQDIQQGVLNRLPTDPQMGPPLTRPPNEPTPLPLTGELPRQRSGGIDISGGQNTFRDVAGRDLINNFIQVFYREDPYVQTLARFQVTEALKDCLVRITTQNKIVFLIDHWSDEGFDCDKELRIWLEQTLVEWTANCTLPQSCTVIAGDEGTSLEARRCMEWVELDDLPPEAVYHYIVKINHIPESELKQFEFAGGDPTMLLRKVNQWKRRNRVS
jgi:hypothetical protein